MARIKNSLMGQLSGRVGGFVYSSNKSGAIVRAGTIGTNPKTQVQVRQRLLFGATSRLFRNVGASDRVLWQEWADNYFQPKQGSNSGQFSGYNAFVSIRNVVAQSSRLPQTTTLTTELDGAITTESEDFIAMPSTPIALGFTPALVDTNDNIFPFTLDSATMAQNGTGTASMTIATGGNSNFPDLKSPEGYNIGYIIYCSNGNVAPNLTYQNRFSNCLGYIPPQNLTGATTQLDFLAGVKFDWTVPYDYAQAKRFPIKDEYVLISIYGVNLYGQLAAIDAVEVQVGS